MADMKAEITAAEKRYTDAVNSGNFEGALDCYTDNAKVLAPGAPILCGKEAIKGYFASLAGLGIAKSATEVVEIGGEGNHAYLIYNNVLSKADGSVVDEGKGLALYCKSNGSWKIYCDSVNSNAAPAS